MKDITKEFLFDYMKKNKYSEFSKNGYSFLDLFKLYSSFEITSLDDLDLAVHDFFDFLEINYTHIKTHKRPVDIMREIKMYQVAIESTLDINSHTAEKAYARTASKLAPTDDTTFLDVGAGTFPYSSIILADKSVVTSMDKKFILSSQSLNCMGVSSIEQFYTSKTNIKAYDMVIGRFPCSAIVPIVKTCAKANKPYFIQLCNCDLPSQSKKIANYWSGWQGVLPHYDPKIQIFENMYATNIGLTSEQLATLLREVNNEVYPTTNRSSIVITPEEFARTKRSTTPFISNCELSCKAEDIMEK